MSEKNEAREAARERIEAKRDEFKARREAYKGKAVQITAELLEGIDLRDTVFVKMINGDIGELTIRPLGEGEIINLFAKVGFDRLQDIGSEERDFDVKDYEFFWELVSISSGLPVELIKKSFAVGESASVGNVILEMSGFSEDVEDEVEGFPEE